jgi:hypothetical protein
MHAGILIEKHLAENDSPAGGGIGMLLGANAAFAWDQDQVDWIALCVIRDRLSPPCLRPVRSRKPRRISLGVENLDFQMIGV